MKKRLNAVQSVVAMVMLVFGWFGAVFSDGEAVWAWPSMFLGAVSLLEAAIWRLGPDE